MAGPAIAMLVNLLRMMLMAKLGAMVVGILLFFGIDLVVGSYVIDPLIDQIRGMLQAGPGGGMGASAIAWAGVLKLDQAITMLLSAYTTAATIRSTKIGLGVAGAA